ncbi:MAG: 1-deoxy-D-xylulose-5-phosphate reductoisomerase [Eubacterium sp.]|nr:1-deoxy-D-xylulose-5-phosphate reductoisomerase [Eubacterium sp.]
MKEKKRIVLLGSTGSIGTQTLDVMERYPDRFEAAALTCGRNIALFREQLAKYRPAFAVCERKSDADMLAAEFPGIGFSWGEEGLIRAASGDWSDKASGSVKPADLVVNALMGMRGLAPTYAAIQADMEIALANKETLVAGGNVIMKAAADKGIEILPIDSEHSAIFQCLTGNRDKKISRILLTASGGPFRGWTRDQLESVTPEMALKHPNWTMGRKITIDSASMMNKGLEMIEARWLFDVPMDKITVLVHPQSIVHSAVEFEDTSVLAQLGIPDMRVPISVALGYPDRLALELPKLDLFSLKNGLTFEEPDPGVFQCLAIAKDAAARGGNRPVIMNAANEILVEAFLEKKVGFLDIPRIIIEMIEKLGSDDEPDLAAIFESDALARAKTTEMI